MHRRVVLMAALVTALLAAPSPALAATISGQVTNGTTGLGEVCVAAYDATAGDWLPAVAEVTTNGAGQYVLTVGPGQYKVGFRHCPLAGAQTWVPEFYDDAPLRWQADTVNVSAGDAPGIDAVLVPGHTISGRTTSNGVTGIQGICVQAFPSANQGLPLGGTVTDSNGDYTTAPVPYGTYKVQFRDCNSTPAYVTEWFSDKTTFSTANTIDLTYVSVTAVNATLAQGHTISGLVTGTGNAPVAGICVQVMDTTGTWLSGAQTMGDGTYRTEPLANGQYKLGFSDCRPSPQYMGEYYDDKTNVGAANPVGVAGVDVTGINAQLAAGRTIAGTVTSAGGGAPLGNVCVALYDATQPGPFTPQVGGTNTAPDGTYSMVVAPGQYKVQFRDCNPSPTYISEWFDSKTNFATADTVDVRTVNAPSVNAALATGRTVSGRVTSDGTTGIPNLCVALNDASVPMDQFAEAFGNTQPDGTFTTDPVAPGIYKLLVMDCRPSPEYISEWWNNKPDFQTADPINLTSGNATGLQIQLGPGRTISGHITTDGTTAVPNGCVAAWPAGVTNPDEQPSQYGTMVNPDGSYRLGPIPPGSYRLQFGQCAPQRQYFSEWYDDSPDFAGSDPVDISTTNATGIDAVLAMGKTISGRVTSDGTTGIANVCVNVYAAGDDPYGEPAAGRTTDGNGDYTAGPLHDGSYRVQFNDCTKPAAYLNEWYDDVDDPSAATLVNVTPGNVTGINATLELGRTISGTVENGSGAGIPNVCVTVNSATIDDKWVGGAETSPDGTYTTQPLPPGQYKVQFRDCNTQPTYVGEWFDDTSQWDGATVVDVTSASATGIDAVLAHGHTISGTVTNGGGLPIGGVCVNVRSATEEGVELSGSGTQADGSYVTDPVPPGPVKLHFEDCNDPLLYVSEYFSDEIEWSSAAVIDITADSVTGYDAVLEAGKFITGTVTADGTGLPIQNVCLNAVSATGEEHWFNGGWTAADGTYRSEPLRAGIYRLQAWDCNDPTVYVNEWFDGATTFPDATNIDLTTADATADFQLAVGGAITGTVRAGTSGSPGVTLGSICVSVYVPDGPDYGEVQTQPDGTYRIGGLRTGTYGVNFYDCREDQSAGTYPGRNLENISVTAPNTTTGANAFMGALDNDEPDTFITSGPTGTTDRSTAQFSYASTEAGSFECTIDGNYPVAGTWCDGNAAQFTGLAPGTHTLEIWAWDQAGHRDQTPAVRTWTVDQSVPLQTHSTKGTLPSTGGTVSDDPFGSGATVSDQLLTAVTAPGAGDVVITSQPVSGTPPAGFALFSRQVVLGSTVPTTAAGPLRIAFTVDASLLLGGTVVDEIVVFRNGIALPNCVGGAVAEPDPCVLTREALAGGDARITVLSSTASTWTLGVGATPATPGKPAGNPAIATNGLTVMWEPAAGAITYTLEARDADDAGFTSLASGLTTPSFTYAGAPPEGTFTYRVKAVALPGKESGWSAVSNPVVVDRTGPASPVARPDRTAESGGWFLNTVTVFFDGAGDPGPDGPGSGVDPTTLSPSQTFTTTATHTASGTVRDHAGNLSAVASLSVRVDADAPQVSIACPSSIAQNAAGSAHWTAVDLGSGLVTPTAGDVPLATGATGTFMATAPGARDAVGHAPAAVSCAYTVVAGPTAAPTVRIVTTKVRSTSKGVVGIRVACTGATCAGKLSLRAKVKVGGRTRTLTLGAKSFSLTAGTTKTVKIRLSKSNLKILKRVRKVRATAAITLAGATGTSAKATVVISAPKR